MDNQRIKKRLGNIQRIKSIIEVAKFDTLKEIRKTNKIMDHHYEMARTSREIINFAQWKNMLIKSKNRFKKINETSEFPKTLWIYVTITSKFLRPSFATFEKIITENYNAKNGDAIIPIGKSAINFSQNKKYEIVKSFKDISGIEEELSSISLYFIHRNIFDRINLVTHSSKFKDTYLQIYPFKTTHTNIKEMSKKTFYYSLHESIRQISYNYIKNIIYGIFQESHWNFLTEKLAKHESSLKNIDKRIVDLKRDIMKNQRKNETEEMIQTIQSTKRR